MPRSDGRSLRVLFDISAHGLGHLAQSAPVIAAFTALRPDVEIILRSGLGLETLQRRVPAAFQHIPSDDDFGLVMTNSFVVNRQATVERYLDLHSSFDDAVLALGQMITDERVDIVVSNIGYTILAAANRARRPAIAFSSINWRDVVRHYCGEENRLESVLATMAEAYRSAREFIRLVPGTSMADFATTPLDRLIVALGRDRRAELRKSLALDDETITVAFSFTENEMETPPDLTGASPRRIAPIGPMRWSHLAGWTSFASTGMPFLDLIRSADLVVAKPGYGIVTEAAVAGTPTLLTPRDDWPETATTSQWHRQHGRFETTAVPLSQLTAAQLCHAHARLESKPATTEFRIDGASVIADRVARLLPHL